MPVDEAVGRDDPPRRKGIAAIKVGDGAAGLGNEQYAGGDIVEIEIEFPEPIEFAGRHIGEIERRRTAAADIANGGQQFNQSVAEALQPAIVANDAPLLRMICNPVKEGTNVCAQYFGVC